MIRLSTGMVFRNIETSVRNIDYHAIGSCSMLIQMVNNLLGKLNSARSLSGKTRFVT